MAITFRGDTFLTADEVLGNLALARAAFQRQLAAANGAYLTDAQHLYKPQRKALLNAFPIDLRADPLLEQGYNYINRNSFFADVQKQVTFVRIIENDHPVTMSMTDALKESIAAILPAIVVGHPPSIISPAGFGIHPDWPINQVGSSAGNSVSPPAPPLPLPRPQVDPTQTPLADRDVYTPPSELDESSTGLSNEDAPLIDADDVAKLESVLREREKEASESGASGQLSSGGTGAYPQIGVEEPRLANPVKAGSPVNAGGRGAGATGLTANVKEIEINPRINELNNYSSYTYNIALYMLTPKEYIKIMRNPKDPGSATKFLIARSGGIGAGEQPPAEHFDVDFFIDNLQLMNTGASPNTQTTNTNAVDISFELNEPNGVTLLERLKEQAKRSLTESEQSYTDAPYLLEITFKGYDDHGTPISGDIKPKYIPIKIWSIKFNVTNSGAVYRIKAMPFHQNVFGSIYSNIPINIQVKAGTVKDIFGESAEAQVEEEVVREDALVTDFDERTFTTTMEFGGEKVSLTAAINSYFKRRTKPSKQKDGTKKEVLVAAEANLADVWEFYMAPEIGDAKIQPDRFDALNTSGKTKKVYEQFSKVLRGKVGLDKKKQLFRINDGTNLIQLMNAIIVGSDYIDKNLLDDIEAARASKETQGKQINWFKIVPEILDVIGWDSKANRYKWRIRWTVITTGVFYNDYAWAPKTKPKGKGIHKIYDYIFSGKNTEVLSFNLNFDIAYVEAVTLGTGIPNAADDQVQVNPGAKKKLVSRKRDATGVVAADTVTKKRSQDLQSSIMHKGTDLIQADIDIIGDPAFLPIGDALFQPIGNNNTIWDEPFLPDGTINYDLTPPYVQVNLKTPTDYDELTGFADPNQKYEYSSSQFSGVYQIFRTKSTFAGGVFTQTLLAVRTKMQPIGDSVGRSVESNTEIERKEFFQDVRQYASALQYLSGILPGLANNIGVKITDIASSAITNIGTNIIGRVASEVNQNRNAVFFDADDAGTDFPEEFPEETPAQRDERIKDRDPTEILVA